MREQFLGAGDLADLKRLDELFEDGEGWDLPKPRMTRLAELGVIRHHSRGYYSITSFGRWVLGAFYADLPLQTVAQFNEAQRLQACAGRESTHA